jgi:hypothetical protein
VEDLRWNLPRLLWLATFRLADRRDEEELSLTRAERLAEGVAAPAASVAYFRSP